MEQSTETAAPKKRSGKGGRILAIILLLLILGTGIFIWWRYYFTYSDGNRFGQLQKFSRKGSLFKTYEGELVLSSVRGNNNVPIASEKFFFSVTDEAVAQQLNNLQGHNITVHYQEKNSAAFWRGESPYLVDSVRKEP
jgi:hypothetical protein